MKQAKVSILIPVYNVENYLAKCLDSLVNQTLQEIEIIAVADESTDRSSDILEEYASRDSRIKIVHQERTQNFGLAGARNIGIRNASGKYIMFVDTDDWLELNAVEELYSYAEEKQLDMLSFDYVSELEPDVDHSKKSQLVHKRRKADYPGIYSGIELLDLMQKACEVIYASWSDIYRTDFIKSNNLQFYEGILCEDVYFRFVCIIKAKRSACINKAFYHYNVRTSSLTGRVNDTRPSIIKADIVFLSEAKKIISKSNFSDYERKVLSQYCGSRLGDFLNNYYKVSETDLQKICFKEQNQYKLFNELIFYNDYSHYLIRNFTDEERSQITGFKNFVIYGAGSAGKQMVNILSNIGIDRFDVAITKIDRGSGRKYISGLEIKEIGELNYIQDQTLILVCIKNKNNSKQMSDYAKDLGYVNIWEMGR